MIEDAIVNKKIDLILTKSISRFARNTVDSLSTIRKLKEVGVEVYFEKENIWTFDSKGEMLLTIMSSIAQEESRSISENVLWGIRRKFEEGRYSLNYSHFLGYDRGDDGRLVINEKQAEVVRFIYKSYLEGKTPYTIANTLMKNNIKTPSGKSKWYSDGILSILQNEKYTGNAILQKTYKRDLLSKREVNNGEVKKYLVEDSHDAIISKEDFDMVQLEIKQRKGKFTSSKSIFSNKLYCPYCNEYFGQKLGHSTDKYRSLIWQCNGKYKVRGNKNRCSLPHLKEEQIKEIFLKALKQLLFDKDSIIKNLEETIERLKDSDELKEKLEKAEHKLVKASEEYERYVQSAVLTREEVERGKLKELEDKYNLSQKKVDELRETITDRLRRSIAIRKYLDEIKNLETISEFTDNLWLGLCERITIFKDTSATVRFKGGEEVKI